MDSAFFRAVIYPVSPEYIENLSHLLFDIRFDFTLIERWCEGFDTLPFLANWMKIPNVEFSPAVASEASIEIIDLNRLYRRRDAMDHSPEKPHRMGFSMMIFITEGSGRHFIDFAHWPFKSGSVIFVNENQINAFDLQGRPKGKGVLFQQALIGKLQSSMRMPLLSPDYLHHEYVPVVDVSDALRVSCDRLLLEIEAETKTSEPDSLVTMHLFAALQIMLDRERKTLRSNGLSVSERRKFTSFVALLEASFTETRNATDYADALHTSYKSLNALCKKATNQTTKQLIDAYTTLEAKRRLVVERTRVQDLADDLGFDEVTNFIKYFKKHTGLTPAHFQKNN